MSTVGHFITMIGVAAFYATILESHFEKKITMYLFSLIPRLNKRALYYLLKLINFQSNILESINLPSLSGRKNLVNEL